MQMCMIHTVHSFHSEGLCPVYISILERQQGSNLCVHCVSCFTKYPCLCLYICCSVSSTPSTFLCPALFRLFQLLSYTPFFTKITVHMNKKPCNWSIFCYINVISERRTNISNNPCCAHSEHKWSHSHTHTQTWKESRMLNFSFEKIALQYFSSGTHRDKHLCFTTSTSSFPIHFTNLAFPHITSISNRCVFWVYAHTDIILTSFLKKKLQPFHSIHTLNSSKWKTQAFSSF